MYDVTNDSNNRLRRISEVVGSRQGDIKKGLKIDFIGEEGVDAGGLRKEWFLLLIREVFDEAHGKYIAPFGAHRLNTCQGSSYMTRIHVSATSTLIALSHRSSISWLES